MRLIDADALMEKVVPKEQSAQFRCVAVKDIINAPTIEERKKGKWILDESPHDGDCRCSACLIAIDQMHERHHSLLNTLTGGKWWTFYKFCPKCGAKMEVSE